MPIVNFSIPATLEHRVKDVIRQKGFASRAELFRFALIRYLERFEEVPFFPLDDDPEIADLCGRLENRLNMIDIERLPSAREQLAKLKEKI